MRKPNKIERMNAYLYAWAILTGRIEDPEKNTVQSLCFLLIDYYNITIDYTAYYFMIPDLYPEIELQKPIDDPNAYWWPTEDKQSRIKALENAIKLLA